MDDAMTDVLDEALDAPTVVERSEEPRGPHLPDALAVIPTPAWIFVLLAVARLIWFVREADLGPAPEPSTIASFVAAVIPSVVAVLLPAALLVRHPDARSRARTLLLGTVLFAVVEGLRVLGTPLQPIFEQLTPGSEEVSFLVPLALAYGAVAGLLGAFAVANVGLGLAQARRYEDRPGTRPIGLFLVSIVILVAGARVVSVSQLPFEQIPMTPTVILYLASTVVLGVLSIAAWGYLATTSVRGARAAEEPESGWTIGAIGTCLVIGAFALSAALSFAGSFARPTPESQPFFTMVGLLNSGIFALGYLGLLAGLLQGMPSLDDLDDELEWDEDDEGDETEPSDLVDALGVPDVRVD